VGEDSKAKWWGYRGKVVGELQVQVVGISRSTGGGTPRSSGGDIEVNWWGELSRSSGGDI
jgi:hypothetical protein